VCLGAWCQCAQCAPVCPVCPMCPVCPVCPMCYGASCKVLTSPTAVRLEHRQHLQHLGTLSTNAPAPRHHRHLRHLGTVVPVGSQQANHVSRPGGNADRPHSGDAVVALRDLQDFEHRSPVSYKFRVPSSKFQTARSNFELVTCNSSLSLFSQHTNRIEACRPPNRYDARNQCDQDKQDGRRPDDLWTGES